MSEVAWIIVLILICSLLAYLGSKAHFLNVKGRLIGGLIEGEIEVRRKEPRTKRRGKGPKYILRSGNPDGISTDEEYQ